MNDYKPSFWLTAEQLHGYATDLTPAEQLWGSLQSKERANLCSDTIAEVAEVRVDSTDRIGSHDAETFGLARGRRASQNPNGSTVSRSLSPTVATYPRTDRRC